MAIDSVRFNNAVTTPIVAPTAPATEATKGTEAAPSFKGEGEEKKGGHVLRNTLIALGAAGAGYLLYKKFNKGAADKIAKTIKGNGGSLEVSKAVEKDGKVTRTFVKKNEKGEVIETVTREYGPKGTKGKYTSQTVTKPEAPQAEKVAEAAEKGTNVTSSKAVSDKRVTSHLSKMDAEIELSELATTPTAHANREKDIMAAFAERDASNAKNALANAKTAEAGAANLDIMPPPTLTLRERTDAFIDAKAAFTPIKPTSVSKDGRTVYGKLRDGAEYIINTNKKGEPTQYIAADGKLVLGKAKAQAFIQKQGIDLSV